jgi:hypothetical protein
MKKPFRLAALFVALLGAAPVATPVFAAAAEAPAKAPEYTDEQKALLKALDAELVRFEAMLAKDDDAAHAASVKELLAGFKARRDTMNKVAFDQGKYDELRFDINVEYQRLAQWLLPTNAPAGR